MTKLERQSRLAIHGVAAARLSWLAVPAALLLLLPGVARAASPRCFEVSGTMDGTRSTSARRVTLATGLSLRAQCEYGLSPEGPWVAGTKLAASSDFASLLLELREQAAGNDDTSPPTSVFARRLTASAGAPDPGLESVFLSGTCKYLLNGEHGLSLTVAQASQHPSFERTADTQACDAKQLAFAFVERTDSLAPVPPALQAGPFGVVLATSASRTSLEPGSYAVYALRPKGVGYLIGEVRSGSSLSPLRTALRDAARQQPSAANPLLRASWGDGELRMEASSDALRQSAAWAELRAAASSGALFYASYDGHVRPTHNVLGKVLVDAGGDAFGLPTEHVVKQLRARYGVAAAHVVPTFSDWRAITRSLSLCVASRYDSAPPSAAQPVPTDAICAVVSSVLAPLSVHGGGSPLPAGQVCIKHYAHELSVQGTRTAEPVSDTCVALPTGNTAEPLLMSAATGDALLFGVASTQGLFVCTDNRCEPAPPADRPLTLTHSGLLELRLAGDGTQALSPQGLTLLRVAVIDPAIDWQPLGLYHAKGTAPDKRWTLLDHDATDVFSFVRGRDSLASALAVSASLQAAWNAQPEVPALLSRELPSVRPIAGSWNSPRPAAFVVLTSRDASCPDKPAGELAPSDLVTPEGLLVDEEFYAHLAVYEGERVPYRCLARARLRITEHWTRRLTPRLRAGLLGDTQALMFVTNPPALGLAVPLVYARYRLVSGLGLDASGSVTVAAALDHGQLSRAGLGLSGSAYFGPERYAPRLLSVGVMLHAASGSHPDKPLASLFLALDLSTLYDLAGGR